MKFKIILFVFLSLLVSNPASAQWQTPNHSVPLGRGAGITGFGNAAPGAAGLPLISNGASVDPSFQALNLGIAGAITGQLPNANLVNQSTAVNGQTCALGGSCTMPAINLGGGSSAVTGQLPNANLVNSSTTVNGQVCTLGGSCTTTGVAGNIYAPESYGAKADLIGHADGAITASTATFNSASATFSSADIGKLIAIPGAGVSGGLLATTIAAYGGNPHQVSLTVNAGTTVSAANYQYSTDSTPGVQAAVNAAEAVGGDVQFQSSGAYGMNSINLTNPAKAIRILGVGPLSWGTHLVAMSNVNALLDATGHDALQISNFTVTSGYPDSTVITAPNIGILIAPSTAIPGVDIIRADNIRVTGQFGTAAWYLDRIYGAVFTNTSSFQYADGAASGFVLTKSNISGVSSVFTSTKTYNSSTDSIGSFTFIRCEFHDFGSTPFARPSMFIDGLVDSVWIGGLISGNGTTISPSNNPTGLLFQGVQFSADNTTLTSVFGAGALNFVTTINTDAGGTPYGGTISNFAPLGRQ